MAITTYDAYKTKIAAPHQAVRSSRIGGANVRAGKMNSMWTVLGVPGGGTAPTTAVAPTRTTTGAMGQNNPVTADLLRLLSIECSVDPNATNFQGTTLIIADRLSHQGGLDGNSASVQTTNLPTAALTRYTSGVGVLGAIEIYTSIGATPTTFTVSYTNQAGTAGRTSQATDIGGSNFAEALLMLPIPLQQGDTGIRSVESVTLAAGTGTVGAFGITLYWPIALIPLPLMRVPYKYDSFTNLFLQMEQIINDACLWSIFIPTQGNMPFFSGTFYFSED